MGISKILYFRNSFSTKNIIGSYLQGVSYTMYTNKISLCLWTHAHESFCKIILLPQFLQVSSPKLLCISCPLHTCSIPCHLMSLDCINLAVSANYEAHFAVFFPYSHFTSFPHIQIFVLALSVSPSAFVLQLKWEIFMPLKKQQKNCFCICESCLCSNHRLAD